MGKAVCHVEKSKGSVGGLQGHIDREPGKERTYKNADPARSYLNRDLTDAKFADMRIDKAIALRINEGYTATKVDSSGEVIPAPLRKDAVKSLQIILSGTHEDMIEIFSKPDKGQAWIDANMVFLDKAYGKENIVKLVLHMDEKTPHLHAVIVPLTKDGRLSAKEIIGNAQKLSTLQTLHAYFMKPFGLERGEVGSKAAHVSAGEFQAKIMSVDRATEAPVEIKAIDLINLTKVNQRLANERIAHVQRIAESEQRAVTAENRAKEAEKLNVGLKEGMKKAAEIAEKAISGLKREVEILLYRVSGVSIQERYEKAVDVLLLNFKKEKLDPETDRDNLFTSVNELIKKTNYTKETSPVDKLLKKATQEYIQSQPSADRLSLQKIVFDKEQVTDLIQQIETEIKKDNTPLALVIHQIEHTNYTKKQDVPEPELLKAAIERTLKNSPDEDHAAYYFSEKQAESLIKIIKNKVLEDNTPIEIVKNHIKGQDYEDEGRSPAALVREAIREVITLNPLMTEDQFVFTQEDESNLIALVKEEIWEQNPESEIRNRNTKGIGR